MTKQTLPLKKYYPHASRIAYGCMGLGGEKDNSSIMNKDISQAHSVIEAALAYGINFFDHADIYGDGRCEELFSEVLKEMPEIRKNILITSKCGIVKNNNPNPNIGSGIKPITGDQTIATSWD